MYKEEKKRGREGGRKEKDWRCLDSFNEVFILRAGKEVPTLSVISNHLSVTSIKGKNITE